MNNVITKLPALNIGNLKISPPIIQGGMGVKVSMASLASAVSRTGALGVIASVGLGKDSKLEANYVDSSNFALEQEIRKAKKIY